jgi:tRNA-specific 2-thiouridylase
VRVRYRHDGVAARLERIEANVSIAFERPVRAVSKGQIAVAYAGDRVLGGGTIDRAIGGSPT